MARRADPDDVRECDAGMGAPGNDARVVAGRCDGLPGGGRAPRWAFLASLVEGARRRRSSSRISRSIGALMAGVVALAVVGAHVQVEQASGVARTLARVSKTDETNGALRCSTG